MEAPQVPEYERTGGAPPKYSNEVIRAALVQSKGMVSLAARLVGCDPDTIYRRMEHYPELRAIRDNSRLEFLDTAELKLHHAVLHGEPWAIRYTLDQLGQTRGYGRVISPEPNEANATPWGTLTDEELDARIRDNDRRIAAIEDRTGPTDGGEATP